MSFAPFTEDELADAKAAFALAYYEERRKAPFEPDPFKAALTLWNEDNGELQKALWVAHSAKWHKDAEVLEIVEEYADEAAEEYAQEKITKAAEIETPEFKRLVKAEMIAELRDMMKNQLVEAKDRTGAMDRLSKLMGLDEKPKLDDEDAGKVLGVIHHRLAPMTPDQFADFSRRQQGDLQNELIGMAEGEIIEATAKPNVRTIN